MRASLLILVTLPHVSIALMLAPAITRCNHASSCRTALRLSAEAASSSLVAEIASVMKKNRTPDRHWNGLIATCLKLQQTRLQEVFTAVDEDGDGFIIESELAAAMKLTNDGELAEKADQVWQLTIAERNPTEQNPFHRNFKRDCSADDPSKIDFDEFYNTYVDQAYLILNAGKDDGSGGISLGAFFEGILGKK